MDEPEATPEETQEQEPKQDRKMKLIWIFGIATLVGFLICIYWNKTPNYDISAENKETGRDFIASTFNAEQQTFVEPITVDGIPIIPDVPIDAITPLDHPTYESLEEADKWLKEDDMVLGVEHNGDTRAYPIRIMYWHEIINDAVGTRKIAITYSPLSNSGIVFDRQFCAKILSFGNTGALYENAMVLYDRETKSYWYQISGEALTGELAGKQLTILPSYLTSWKEWRDRHPGTVVLATSTGYVRPYDQDQHEVAVPLSGPTFPVSHLDDRLAPKDMVVGVMLGNEIKAYPIRLVGERIIEDTLGGKRVEIRGDGVSAQAFFVNDGRHIKAPQTTSYWFAWSAAYPETQIYSQ